ncbi:hypothetical protein N9Q22_00155 [bacterium]|nr:hypothetical protein [bacterium]
MRIITIILLCISSTLFSQTKNDSILVIEHQEKIEILNKKFNELTKKYDYQLKISDQTLNSISNQIGATSFNLSIFAFLFGILAIILGIYVTWVERKIIKIRGQNESLLEQTITTKNKVVEINELIQKDINGLFVKIKREETISILNRLCKVPDDILNVSTQLFSRELLKEDYATLRKAYLVLTKESDIERVNLNRYKTTYYLLFFQHFLDLIIKDEILESEMTQRFSQGISGANANDIIKSTEDFTKGIIDLGFQSKEKQINAFLKSISNSEFKNFEKIYEIFYNSLKERDDKFKFFEIISDTKELRIPKSNFGKLLIKDYGKEELSNSEKNAIIKTEEIILELETEQKKIKEAKEKKEKETREKKEAENKK